MSEASQNQPVPDVIEAISTTRAIRRFQHRPVEPQLIEKLIFAATRAPSPGNTQQWAFLVVQDRQRKAAFASLVSESVHAVIERARQAQISDEDLLVYTSAAALVDTLADVPVLILVCATGVKAAEPVPPRVWMAVYPAAQNLLLAARSLGLGATLTSFHSHNVEGIRSLFNLPDDVIPAATIPLGWPDQAFGPVRRRPVASVLHWETW
jgi:nitroreductase